MTSLHVSLTKAEAELLVDLVRPTAGTYVLPCLPQLQIVVEWSEIKDNEGHVVEVIGPLNPQSAICNVKYEVN